MKLKIKPALKLYLFIGGIALLLTIAVLPLLPDWFEKYKAETIRDTRSFPHPDILYHDFDHDGYSELAVLKYQRDINESALKVYAHNGGLIAQWTLGERWLPKSMIFGDYDHDGCDEVYVFTQARDSLFLYAVDPLIRKKFIVKRRFIVSAPQKAKSWDLRPIAGTFLDSDRDGYNDLIFNVMAGPAVQPRRLFCFSVQKKQIIRRSPPGSAFLARPQAVAVKNKNYILMKGSVSLENDKSNIPFSDRFAWLTVLDENLKFAFQPVKFRTSQTELAAIPFGKRKQSIIVLLQNRSFSEPAACLLLYDWQGNELARRALHGTAWQILEKDSRVLLIDLHNKLIYRIDPRLNLQQLAAFSAHVRDFLCFNFDLDNDFEEESLARQGNRLLIFSSDFNQVLPVPLPGFHWDIYNISLKKNGDEQPRLYLQSGETRYWVAYQLNPLYPLRHFEFFALFLLFSLIIGQGVSVYNRISAYRFALASILSNPARGMMLLSPKGKIKFMNHALIDQFKLGVTEYKNSQALRVFAPFPSFVKIIKQIMNKPAKLKEELFIAQDKVRLKAAVFAKPINVLFGYTYGYYIEINDYDRPVRDDRMKVWSKTVQKMAHDIKTPLSSISINLAMIKKKLSDQAPQALNHIGEDIELMLGEMERLREMTKNFLKFTNLEKPNLQSFSLNAFLREVMDYFKTYYSETLDFILDIDYKEDVIRADRAQLKMALQALIENAIDAVKGRGIVGLSAAQIQRVDQGFEDFIEIEIFDNGPGISPDVKEKIFEPYFSTKPDGTGMGLAIAKKIIEDHNGSIDVISTEKFSTVFRIMLPIGNISQ